MTVEQLASLNTWVALIAITGLLQLTALATMAFCAYRLYSHGRRAIADAEQRHLAPLALRLNRMLDGVDDAAVRLGHAGDRVRQTVQGLHDGASHVTSVVKSTVLPGWALAQGLLAAISAFRGGGSRHLRGRRAVNQEAAEAAYEDEGGN